MFGGVERESGKIFLVPVPDRTVDTLMGVVSAWIEPGTAVIRDYWAECRDLEAQGLTHRTVNHSIAFVDEQNGAHTNTIESTWRRVKAFLNRYSRKEIYIILPVTCSRHDAEVKTWTSSRNSSTSFITRIPAFVPHSPSKISPRDFNLPHNRRHAIRDPSQLSVIGNDKARERT